ncbi:helix-turn-helix domain-containing protein [Paenibacillus turicensis]|uniref:helix-turn-helix domain-containing protein n=1 Tax=Paenibacillus turicensis TaxID=160487 RepID=UPI003D2E5540
MYYDIIQQSIKYIEQNLDQDLNLDIVAKQVGFSKYHFHRIFSKYVGQSLNTYIRYRRLTSSAYLLLYTDERILDIALHYGFESQEAFTRAFKALYSLPPASYRSQMKLLIPMKEGIIVSNINGWFTTGTSPNKYDVHLDHETYHEGSKSLCLASNQEIDVTTNEFGTLMQQFQAKQYIGKRMRFSGFVQTENVNGWCGLWMRVDDQKQNMLAFDNMEYRSIKGTVSWNYYACVLDIPDEAATISIGILLSGSGKVWLDNCQFEEVGKDIEVTQFTGADETLPIEPQNLTFED